MRLATALVTMDECFATTTLAYRDRAKQLHPPMLREQMHLAARNVYRLLGIPDQKGTLRSD